MVASSTSTLLDSEFDEKDLFYSEQHASFTKSTSPLMVESPCLTRTITGQTTENFDVDFHFDKRKNVIRINNTVSGIKKWIACPGGYFICDMSRDGRYVVACSPNTASIFEVESGDFVCSWSLDQFDGPRLPRDAKIYHCRFFDHISLTIDDPTKLGTVLNVKLKWKPVADHLRKPGEASHQLTHVSAYYFPWMGSKLILHSGDEVRVITLKNHFICNPDPYPGPLKMPKSNSIWMKIWRRFVAEKKKGTPGNFIERENIPICYISGSHVGCWARPEDRHHLVHLAEWDPAEGLLYHRAFPTKLAPPELKTSSARVLELDSAFCALTKHNAPSSHMRSVVKSRLQFGIRSKVEGKRRHTLAAFPRYDATTKRSVVDVWDVELQRRRFVVSDKDKNLYIRGDTSYCCFAREMKEIKVCAELVRERDIRYRVRTEVWSIPER